MNINGITSKIEKKECLLTFNEFDIVCFNELKTTYPFSLPGFECIRSLIIAGEEQRGGVAVLFKSQIWNDVHEIQRERDLIWFKLFSAPGFRFCAVYLTPSDSEYFDPSVISLMQAGAMKQCDKVLLIGDINARLQSLEVLSNPEHGIKYATNKDPSSNQNGASIKQMCMSCNLKPVNHLIYNNKEFPGSLTFRQRDKWISQLDWCIMSANSLMYVESFNVLQDSKLPTNHAPIAIKLQGLGESLPALVERSKWLGNSIMPKIQLYRNPIPIHKINHAEFLNALPPPNEEWYMSQDINFLAQSAASTLYAISRESKQPEFRLTASSSYQNANQRWQKLLSSNDSREVWRAIDWNGSYKTSPDSQESPSDEEFCVHYDKLMNPPVSEPATDWEPPTPNYVPILDDPISPVEVDEGIASMKANKAAGVDGISPGVLKLLPAQWIIFFTFLFNLVFQGFYPIQWAVAKVFNIFKKGDKCDPGNYRGIAIMVAIAKLYDIILCRRFLAWYKPLFEQAGAQKKRGCEEQIFVIRLLIDIARKCKLPLYIAYIDYMKAYDKVNRTVLLKMLYAAGCGTVFLMAIAASLVNCTGLIGSMYFDTSAGVRQGASTSCPLFTFFIDATILAVNAYGPDGWLGCLHILLLMDDTVIFATSRESLQAKLKLLKAKADELGMVIHPTKSKYMSTDISDKSPIILDSVIVSFTSSVIVSFTEKYTYLGAIITMDSIANQLKLHFKEKQCHILKFYAFLYKNNDAPFIVKKQVWNSALTSALFYSSETWLTYDLKPAERAYLATLKQLLGVRKSIPTECVYIESGIPAAKPFIRNKQLIFLKKLIARDNFWESYIGKAVALAQQYKTPASRVINELLELPDGYDFLATSLETMKSSVSNSDKSRHRKYTSINPTMCTLPLYNTAAKIPEHQRIALTRIRLSSHRLRIETGRWTRPKTPEAERLCQCGDGVQDEDHALLRCKLTLHLRKDYKVISDNPGISCTTLLTPQEDDLFNTSKLCYEVLHFYANYQR